MSESKNCFISSEKKLIIIPSIQITMLKMREANTLGLKPMYLRKQLGSIKSFRNAINGFNEDLKRRSCLFRSINNSLKIRRAL